MKKYILTMTFLAILCSCTKKNEQTNNSVIMPLKVGNYWEYIDSTFSNIGFTYSDTSRLTISGSKIISFEGMSYHVFLWTWNSPYFQNSSFYVSNETNGLYFYGGTNGHRDFVLTKSLNCKFPVQAGELWYSTEFSYNGTDSSIFIVDTVQMQCASSNSVFKSKIGNTNCYSYQYTRTLPKILNQVFVGSSGFKDTGGFSTVNTLYYSPNIGYIGSIQTLDGIISFKKTLLSYHLN
jgi:hypothetical protein